MAGFKDRIKQLRIENELTMKELSLKLNLSEATISYYESGKREPKDAVDYIKIADFFDVSLDYLLGRVDKKDSIIVNDTIEGHEIEMELDRKVYPDGLTHDQVVAILNQLKEMGMDFTKFKKE